MHVIGVFSARYTPRNDRRQFFDTHRLNRGVLRGRRRRRRRRLCLSGVKCMMFANTLRFYSLTEPSTCRCITVFSFFLGFGSPALSVVSSLSSCKNQLRTHAFLIPRAPEQSISGHCPRTRLSDRDETMKRHI